MGKLSDLRAMSESQELCDRTVLIGNTVERDLKSIMTVQEGIRICGESGDLFLTDKMLSRGLLNIGSTGSGKTNLICLLLQEILKRLTTKDIVVIFDAKGDFYRLFYNENNPNHIVISTRPEHRKQTLSWNVFGELFDKEQFDGCWDSNETAKTEISKALFKNIESEQQPFFHLASSDVLRMLLTWFIRKAYQSGDFSRLTNSSLISLVENLTTENLLNMADEVGYRFIHSYLGSPQHPTPQSLGVEGFLQSMCSTQFVSIFREKAPKGDFSMRQLIQQKQAKVVFVEFDIARGDTLSPIYSLLFNLAIKEQLSLGEGALYLITDEMSQLPYADKLSAACNVGRSRGIKLIAGLQSIQQLYAQYGEEEGKSIAAGFVNAIQFNAVDYTTREWFSQRMGKTYEVITYGTASLSREGFTVSDVDIHNLEVGEAYCDLFGLPPFKIKFKEFHEEV